jgi:hypothetical protein
MVSRKNSTEDSLNLPRGRTEGFAVKGKDGLIE